MSEHDRRAVIRLAMGAAMLSVLGSNAAVARAAPVAARSPIAPPAAPMVFARRLVRQLGDGAELVVERRFGVRFHTLLEGFEVTGRQASAQVSAPAWLNELARLEERRVEQGIFPLQLDLSGKIVSGETAARTAQIEEALRNVSERFGFANGVAPEERELAQLVEELHQTSAGLVSQLPHDLFAPEEARREQTRQIPLPWGESGAVTTRFTAERDVDTGLMREARRDVVTRLGGETRRTTESWTLHGA